MAGDATSALRCARALERAGQEDDALDVLVAARLAPEVRRELGRFPSWNANAGQISDGSGYLDVEPLRGRPRVRWRVPGERTDQNAQQVFLAGPLAVVSYLTPERIVVLDPEEGRVIFELPRVGRAANIRAAIHGDVLLVAETAEQRPRVIGYDLGTGNRLWELGEVQPCLIAAEERLLLENEGDSLVAHEISNPREAPVRTWRAPVGEGVKWVIATESLVACQVALPDTSGPLEDRPDHLVLLDRRTGARLRVSTRRAMKGDAHGLVAEDRGTLFHVDATNEVAWPARASVVCAVGPAFLLTYRYAGGQYEVELIERETGVVLVPLGRLLGFGPRAIARDVLYLQERRVEAGRVNHDLEARDRHGALLWRLAPEELGGLLHKIAPARRRLYARGRDGTVLCLEE